MNFEWATREAADPGYLEDAATEDYVAAIERGRNEWSCDWNGSLTYNGTITFPTATATSGTYTITCGGGGGGYATSTNDGWVYLGATNDTFHLYEPPNVFRDPVVDQPWTQEKATHEWLRVELELWLRAEQAWNEGARKRQREAAEAKAEALLMSMLPEAEKERYRLNGYFEVIGSHGGHYRIR